MRILFCSASFDQRYGGPAYSVSALAAAMSRKVDVVHLWAPDGSAHLAAKEGKMVAHNASFQSLLDDCDYLDLVHDSGIWLKHNHLIAKFCEKNHIARVVSTRGMLEPWARKHKRWKKQIAWWLYQKSDLSSADVLHATSEIERHTLFAASLGPNIIQLPNGVDLPDLKFQRNNEKDRVALFIGRLHPIKGLKTLLDAWALLRPKNWLLKIAGPSEDGFQNELLDQAHKLELSGSIQFLGEIGGLQKAEEFAKSSFLVLPSHSESFGMVVAEALAHARPVLTTHKVPWLELEERECGWRTSDTATGLAQGLSTAMECSTSKLERMGLNGRKLIEEQYCWPSIAKSFHDLYHDMISKYRTKI